MCHEKPANSQAGYKEDEDEEKESKVFKYLQYCRTPYV